MNGFACSYSVYSVVRVGCGSGPSSFLFLLQRALEVEEDSWRKDWTRFSGVWCRRMGNIFQLVLVKLYFFIINFLFLVADTKVEETCGIERSYTSSVHFGFSVMMKTRTATFYFKKKFQSLDLMVFLFVTCMCGCLFQLFLLDNTLSGSVKTMDITGGAPELNAQFRLSSRF